ncbi:MAG: ATP-binding protein [Anaerolineales bacterium]|nr:ATP-binding protein [Anaerolineales bacterium]
MKLTTKLILAFLLVSVLSTGLVVLSTRVAANLEFDNFLRDRYKTELAEQLAKYYKRNRTWDGVEEEFRHFGRQNFRPNSIPRLSFCITDAKGAVIVPGASRQRGEIIGSEILQYGAPIIVDGETVGVVFVETPTNDNPMESEFLRRLDVSIFLSAVGAIFLALLTGIFLSSTITRPIRELTKATHSMTDGNLGQQVPVRSRDEIGELAHSFNKMSSDLARSFNLRKQMTADIAHELRTPLSLILGHAEGVHDGVLAPTRENFEIIREEAERLEHLVNDLRTLSLADAGELSVEFQPININAFMSDIHAHYLSLFNQKRITLNLTPAPVMLTANLDPNRFAQVLTNILDNALHHTPAGGRVELKTQLTGNRIQLSVKDSGAGVTSADAAHLFDRFYRVDESRARDDGGSGLGLAIAKSIVEMHGGKIWAESEKGQGLKVVIELPMA